MTVGIIFRASILGADPTNIGLWGWPDTHLPTDPIPVGNWVTYDAIFDDSPYGMYWYYRCTVAAPPPDFTDAGYYSNDPMFLEARVGTQDIKVTERKGPTGPFVSFTKSISVAGPDADTVTDGLNTDSTGNPPTGMSVTVKFKCTVGATDMGWLAQGTPQERIQAPGFDSGWVSGAPGTNYYLQGNTIVDVKQVFRSQAAWNAIPVGWALDDVYQTNRLLITDCTGATQTFTFATRHILFVKTSDTAFQVVQMTP